MQPIAVHTHGIYLNELNDPVIISLSQVPVEKVPIMGYMTSLTGTKKQMERFIKKIKRKPVLIEKYIKTLD